MGKSTAELRPISQSRALERGSYHIHALGPRAILELLVEISADFGGLTHVLERLSRYEAITPAMLRAVGGDCLVSRYLHIVPTTATARRNLSRQSCSLLDDRADP